MAFECVAASTLLRKLHESCDNLSGTCWPCVAVQLVSENYTINSAAADTPTTRNAPLHIRCHISTAFPVGLA